MVDTIKCESELDLTEQFYEKLLLGAIDKRMDRKKIETHDPAGYGQDTHHAMPHRSKAPSKGKERQRSRDETLPESSSRENSLHADRFSGMQTLVESPIDTAQSRYTYGEFSSNMTRSNMTRSRHVSPPSAGFPPPRRNDTSDDAIQEVQEPELRAAQRSSTFASQNSRWWKPSAS